MISPRCKLKRDSWRSQERKIRINLYDDFDIPPFYMTFKVSSVTRIRTRVTIFEDQVRYHIFA